MCSSSFSALACSEEGRTAYGTTEIAMSPPKPQVPRVRPRRALPRVRKFLFLPFLSILPLFTLHFHVFSCFFP